MTLAPLCSLAIVALQDGSGLWPHLAAYVLPKALEQTTLLLAGVALMTGTVGVGCAWLVTSFSFPGRRIATWLLPLPLAIPTYISAYIYADFFGAFGPPQTALRALTSWQSVRDYWFPDIHSLPGAIFVFGIVLYPYVYLATQAMMRNQCAVFVDAARASGANAGRVAWHVTLPLARPAIAVGLALALLETVNDIGASEYLGIQTLTLSVFTTWLNRGSLAGAAQIACIMLVMVAGLVALERYGRRKQSFSTSTQETEALSRIALAGPARWLACLACFIPITLGFALPVTSLAQEVFKRGLFLRFDPELLRHAAVTVGFAASATILTLALSLAAVAALRSEPRPFTAACVNIGGIGYAIPGTVLALGLLAPLVLIDEGLNALMRHFMGTSVGLVIAGSGLAVVIAYAVRFMAIPLGFMRAGFAKIPSEFDDAALLLGARRFTVLRLLYLPLARPAIWGAALLVFVDCMKELPATLLLRPLNVETLSTYLYQFASRGNFEEGALAALLIVVVSILPVMRMADFADAAAAHGDQMPPG
ncbi:MAG: ABC transporter permease [Pseudorhodoplanes sp.]